MRHFIVLEEHHSNLFVNKVPKMVQRADDFKETDFKRNTASQSERLWQEAASQKVLSFQF